MKKALMTSLILTGGLASASAALAEPPQGAAPMPAEMQQMMKTYTPELRQKVMALSPQLKGTIQKLHAGHTRRAKETTLRQVMQEILSDYQAVAAALATDNAEQASEAARRLANHRIPKGGLLPYFPLDKINDADLAVLPAMNQIVEGSALKLADAADAGDLPRAASHMSDIMTGCVACHQKFRGTPGISANLLSPVSK
ncbi:hypothetical protein [Thiobacillus sedimenti]|uniref:Cytochrome c n=1 Tax=Thiobacillus sedimenti TaxID=3110231 RepID=A0ABZ1CL91_9PROT|nr:hypothetical protein [Thiobacillus sp. SCUT-2]WRS38703.1 hypothetical protein VA613_11915 [Thiobacillus sp. SCUT-2]